MFYEKGASVNRMVALHLGWDEWNSALGVEVCPPPGVVCLLGRRSKKFCTRTKTPTLNGWLKGNVDLKGGTIRPPRWYSCKGADARVQQCFGRFASPLHAVRHMQQCRMIACVWQTLQTVGSLVFRQ